ncbi:MAG: 16S rRNA (guanine(966)-N(2))-methyltransferase RsmD [Gammaproteobacteria bacterium]
MAAALHSKAPGSVRIIGGQWRRTRLPVLDVPTLRPSGDRVRETLFNWLQPLIAGSRCLDLFAGTGVLGFEAASRGAREVTMVEQDHKVIKALTQAVRRLSAQAITIVNQDVLTYLDGLGRPFDIVFIDPPFAHGLWEPCMLKLQAGAWLQPSAHVFLETPRGITLSLPARWQVERSGRAGNVDYLLARAH